MSFLPSKTEITVPGRGIDLSTGGILYADFTDPRFLDLLAQSDYILIIDDFSNGSGFPLEGSASAISSLRRCTANRLKD